MNSKLDLSEFQNLTTTYPFSSSYSLASSQGQCCTRENMGVWIWSLERIWACGSGTQVRKEEANPQNLSSWWRRFARGCTGPWSEKWAHQCLLRQNRTCMRNRPLVSMKNASIASAWTLFSLNVFSPYRRRRSCLCTHFSFSFAHPTANSSCAVLSSQEVGPITLPAWFCRLLYLGHTTEPHYKWAMGFLSECASFRE